MAKKQKSPETRNKEEEEIIYTTIRLSRCAAGKKYIKQSKNAKRSPLEPLWGSKKKKLSTKMTF